jgi:hypothetical protein
MNTNPLPAPVQIGPDYHCFVCGEPATGGHFWLPCNSPLDLYARNIYYLRLPCGHVGRCVRVGQCVTPLEFVELPRDFRQQIELNIAAIQRGIQAIGESVDPENLHADLAMRIVFGLLKGEVPPESALSAIRSLMLSREDIRRAEEKLPF